MQTIIENGNTFHFVNDAARPYQKFTDYNLWNAFIRSNNETNIRSHYCTRNNEFVVTSNEDIRRIEDVLDLLEDDLRFKSYCSVLCKCRHYCFRYRDYFKPVTINGEDHLSIGYVKMKK